jgi:ABC-type antimicrobial peptide transport system permease subunit
VSPVRGRSRRRRRRGNPDPLQRLAQFDALLATEPPNGETVPAGHAVSTGAADDAPARAAPMPGSVEDSPGLDVPVEALVVEVPDVETPEGVEPEGVEPEGVEPEGVEPEGVEPEVEEPEPTEPEAHERKPSRRARRRQRRAARRGGTADPAEIAAAASAPEPVDTASVVEEPSPSAALADGGETIQAAPVVVAAAALQLGTAPPKPTRRAKRRAKRRERRARPGDQLDLDLEAHTPAARRARRWSRRRAKQEPSAEVVEPAPEADVDVPTPDAPAHDEEHQLVLVGATDPRAALTAPSTITSADLVNEAIAGLFSRPTRTLLTVLGTMIGLTALVATLGLSRTAGNQIVGRFDEIAATEIDVTSRPADFTDQPNELPWDASARLERLNGVVAAGAMGKADVGKALVSTVPLNDPARQTEFKLAVQGITPSMFDAARAKLLAGRFFDAGHSERADRVAVIGRTAAEQLGIDRLEPLPAIQIGDDPFLVIGIVDDVARVEKLMSSVMIPEGTARELYHVRVPDTVVIETEIGANGLIAQQAPIALRPDNPKGLKITAQPELTQVRESVSGDLDLLFLMLGGVSLLVGAIGIANVTLVSVMERTGEIGLRRALGATRRHVAQQFLVESTAMGLVGGILGASLGILIVVIVSALQGWTAVVDPYIPFVAPGIGGLIGLVAGSYPARRAASTEPVEALRAGT